MHGIGVAVFLDNETSIAKAITCVEKNPTKEGKRHQHWSFVTPWPGMQEP